ncbi:fumarylacetoacetate hydrolase family protein [Streptomonospora nanhaiensis]|uniref:2-keto-4-pentenoate hydratase/2-oxohepta-3-ene-1,7-dioic acid hydratase in catechol pathway n=1 Tax=Streptomonospora nanhaiensis TaxID=1323731 RepID=A0A853BT61_9ACTN|nr:fumarylacetoacetate hydrolase family protein [Streptomonospora nanhaiensis]MBV2365543.1 fumarylacetoacetate hydrolase family protein [Streptomonospora nanhaiensis]MBX9387097.1 fumarylacetoacetate hydrolase family protein [Streptomonospora nanhaiensis]NYI98969.1 2-keto-4-pentenoate hydratase/2-oxohepta-3-ene-1,7-dioic acid hydratase in catechol pathway [Streptomonospora nanhaiensis]
MYLATVRSEGGETAVVVDGDRGLAAVADVVPGAPATALGVIESVAERDFVQAVRSAPDSAFSPVGDTVFTAPYTRPRKIWGIGLNYVEHASDLTESVPEEPASFMKGDHTIIGPGDAIPLPRQSDRVTAEGELGVVIGRECRDVGEDAALDHVWGVCTILDQTAEDILARNPRFLTRSKNFPGFFSFGPAIVPLSEVLAAAGRLADLEVATVLNGADHRVNTVAHMRYSPEFLVAFHSQVMPLFPGDIISTGTPGAAHIRPGDVAGCRIPGVGELSNPVVQGP